MKSALLANVDSFSICGTILLLENVFVALDLANGHLKRPQPVKLKRHSASANQPILYVLYQVKTCLEYLTRIQALKGCTYILFSFIFFFG